MAGKVLDDTKRSAVDRRQPRTEFREGLVFDPLGQMQQHVVEQVDLLIVGNNPRWPRKRSVTRRNMSMRWSRVPFCTAASSSVIRELGVFTRAAHLLCCSKLQL